MLWKHIFNTEHKKGFWHSVEDAVKVAREAGYKMFAWNNDIYRVPDSPEAEPLSEPLGFKVEDVES